MVKLKGGIFLSVKDLQVLTGKTSYFSAWREYRAILDGFGGNKRKITVKEYSEHEGVDYAQVVEYLNEYR